MAKKPDYDGMTKKQLAAALERGLSKEQLRDLVAWHLELESEGPAGGRAGTPAASNRWSPED